MDFLLIAEKPSLMREIKACYDNNLENIVRNVGKIRFMSFSGHVCKNAAPDEYTEWKDKRWQDIDYPIIPDKWLIKPIDDKQKKMTLKEVKAAAGKADGIIVATDSDVEGYGIYWLAEHYLGLTDKYTLRFIEHSLTEKEILSSLLSMTDYHKDPTHKNAQDSFLVRSRADWLFGMNATRLLSVKCGETMRVGRVKAPTIKLIYDNSKAIDEFIPEKYFILVSDYDGFTGVLSNEKGEQIRMDDASGFKEYPLSGTVVSVTSKRVKTRAPKLFDLTTAQAEAGRLFGFSPSRTLNVIQSLYEKHKVISYPRTQCKFVSKEKAKEFKSLLYNMSAFPDLGKVLKAVRESDIKRVMTDKNVVNDSEVQKESHDALLPTSQKANPSLMTDDEQKICHMIYARFLSQFLPDAEEDKTTAVIKHDDGLFFAQGKEVIKNGWRVLFSEAKEVFLPKLTEGQELTAKAIVPVERMTKAPKRLTEHSLIHAMENIANLIEDKSLRESLADSKGIGTSATRANIIKEIIDGGYADSKKNYLYITDLGKRYIESLSGCGIESPEFAAVIDTQIKRVQRGEADYNTVYGNILNDLSILCDKIKTLPQKNTADNDIKMPCPLCGGTIEGSRYSYLCRSCGLKVQKNICGQDITKDMLKELTAGNAVGPLDFKNKKGKKFSASLKLENGSTVFDFSSDITCPVCKKRMLSINSAGAFCGCGFKAFRETYGTKLTETQLKKLITDKETGVINSFVSQKTGKKYSGILFIEEDGKVRIRFPETGKTDEHPSGILCPCCRDKDVVINKNGAFCDCGLKIFRNTRGATLSDDDITDLLTKRRSKTLNFVSKAGKPYAGVLYLNEMNELQFTFSD